MKGAVAGLMMFILALLAWIVAVVELFIEYQKRMPEGISQVVYKWLRRVMDKVGDHFSKTRPVPAEAVKVSRTIDYLILFALFFIVLGGFHIHYMLTGGDWNFWASWKDKHQWITYPVFVFAFVVVAQAWLWGRYRLPWGATVCVLGILLGEWINRYFNFWGYCTDLPVNFCFPYLLIPSAIVLDVILLCFNSFIITAIVGGMCWVLIFYLSNWMIIAPFQMRVVYNGMLMTLADLQDYQYVRLGAPKYIYMFDKGNLTTFGKDVAPVSAFFSGFISILIYFLWHFLGKWFPSIKKVLTHPTTIC